MGIFNFFKKKEMEVESVGIIQARKILDGKYSGYTEEIESTKQEIILGAREFLESLGSRISKLKEIDIGGKREHEKIKILTKQGLDEYIVFLDRLSEKVSKVDSSLDFLEYVRALEIEIHNFIKSSRGKLERARILIGDDLAKSEEIVKNFSVLIRKKVEEKRDLLSRISEINTYKSLERSEGEEEIEVTKNLVLKLEDSLDNLLERKKELELKLEKYIGSEEYKNWESEKSLKVSEQKKVKAEIEEVRKSLDLKELHKKFHESKKKSELIKGYRDNFFEALIGDLDLEILEVLENKYGKLRELREKYVGGISDFGIMSSNSEVDKFESEIFQINGEIKNVTVQIEECKIKLNRLNEKKIRSETENINLIRKILGEKYIIE